MDVLTPTQRSLCMSRIRGKNTKPEIALRTALWSLGLRYRLHTPLPGRPDIVFSRSRLAVFVDGCFWHGCPEHGVKPKTNSAFWQTKLERNIARDLRTSASLKAAGWTVIRIWEHEICQDISEAVERVLQAIGGAVTDGSDAGSRVEKRRHHR
jgi:DNA mismatch endonuclease, patch repair protein